MTAAVAGLALNCWLAAAQRFALPQPLLQAISQVESGGNAKAVNLNADGSVNLGLMQVNSRWLPELSRFGISRADLFQPCMNIHVGAWILGKEVVRYGYTWEAIGAYNAGPLGASDRLRKLRQYRAYATKVISAWKRGTIAKEAARQSCVSSVPSIQHASGVSGC